MIATARLALAQSAGELWTQACALNANRFVAHRHALLSTSVFDFAQTQGEAMIREHRVCNDFGRKTAEMVMRNVHRIIVLEGGLP